MARTGLDKKRLMREIELDRRGNVARKLKELSALLKAARSERRDSVERVRKQCRTAREKLRTMCGVRKERARRAGDEAVGVRRRELHEERHLEKLQRAADRRHQRRAGRVSGGVRSTRAERVAESDDEVRANVPRGLVKVFDKIRRRIKGSDLESRTERFLRWVEENPGEVYAIQERDAEREVRQMVQARRANDRLAEEVPF
ncbi:MAG: hypothetical protein ACOY0T_26615 [Myxococcota bacterium]|jgi:hypothetical protein